MTHHDDELLTRIGAYVDGELSETERDELEALLESSPELREVAESAHWLDRLAQDGAPPAVTAAEWKATKDAILTQAEKPAEPTSAPLGEPPTAVQEDTQEGIPRSFAPTRAAISAKPVSAAPGSRWRRWPRLPSSASVSSCCSAPGRRCTGLGERTNGSLAGHG